MLKCVYNYLLIMIFHDILYLLKISKKTKKAYKISKPLEFSHKKAQILIVLFYRTYIYH